jgi:hypothetical protein
MNGKLIVHVYEEHAFQSLEEFMINQASSLPGRATNRVLGFAGKSARRPNTPDAASCRLAHGRKTAVSP